MSTLEEVFYVASIVAALCTVIGVPAGAVWVLKRLKVANRSDTKSAIDQALQPLSADVRATRERMIRVEAQFGPNGGGLREAVNNVARDTGVVKQSMHGLVDRFEDHLTQSTEDRARLSSVERSLIEWQQQQRRR